MIQKSPKNAEKKPVNGGVGAQKKAAAFKSVTMSIGGYVLLVPKEPKAWGFRFPHTPKTTSQGRGLQRACVGGREAVLFCGFCAPPRVM